MLKWCTTNAFIGSLVLISTLALPVAEEQLTFNVNGIDHYETRTVSDNIVFLTDVQDQFIVTLDYGRNILSIYNPESRACYFSSLENIPIGKDDHIPVLFVEENGKSQEDADVVFIPSGTIPYGYVRLTNDATVAEGCNSTTSFWLERKDGARKRRSYHCNGDCLFVINCCIGFFC